MTDTTPDSVSIAAADGSQIQLSVWSPAGTPRGVVQVLHGLAEHIDRYARFAMACNERGFAVAGHNHRGHGAQQAGGILGHFADRDGMSRVIDDAERCTAEIERRFPGVPLILLGHSMGSYIAQRYVMLKQPALAALILSGSTWPNRPEVRMARLIARVARFFRGPRTHSKLFDTMVFRKYNRQFAPNRTDADWLSRDDDEVDLYVTDPLCGSLSTHSLWLELFDTLLAISEDGATGRVPRELPILITGGDVDPVGGAKAMQKLSAAYQSTGHENVTLLTYADGRHEMLNEINRDTVTGDWLDWIDQHALR